MGTLDKIDIEVRLTLVMLGMRLKSAAVPQL